MPSLPGLLKSLDRLQPRLYSIASSPKAHPREVHLTVSAVRWDSNDRHAHRHRLVLPRRLRQAGRRRAGVRAEEPRLRARRPTTPRPPSWSDRAPASRRSAPSSRSARRAAKLPARRAAAFRQIAHIIRRQTGMDRNRGFLRQTQATTHFLFWQRLDQVRICPDREQMNSPGKPLLRPIA